MDKETREYLERKFSLIEERFSGIDVRFEETKRHFGVIAEGLRSEIRQVAEGVVNVNERLERFRQGVSSLQARMDRLEAQQH